MKKTAHAQTPTNGAHQRRSLGDKTHSGRNPQDAPVSPVVFDQSSRYLPDHHEERKPFSSTLPHNPVSSPLLTPLFLLFFAVTALTLGIASSRWWPLAQNQPTIVVAALLGLVSFFCIRTNTQQRAIAALCVFLMLIGNLRAGPPPAPPDDPNHISSYLQANEEVSITGILTAMPTANQNGGYHLLMETEEILRPPGAWKSHGQVLLDIDFPMPAKLFPGDRMMARATLFAPASFNNPGSFDYRRFLAEKGIYVRGRISSPILITRIDDPTPPSLLHSLRYFPEKLRSHTGGFIDRTLAPKQAGLARAILIGDRSYLPRDQNEQFTTAGVTHLLAISGLHVGLVGFFVFTLFRSFLGLFPNIFLILPARIGATLFSIPFLAGYALIAGLGPPVVRAFLMTVFFALALVCRRRPDLLAALFIAAFLLLAFSPNNLFTPSFQLTFAAVLAIILFWRRFSFLLDANHTASPAATFFGKIRFRRWLLAAVLTSTAALIGTMPLLLFHFNRISPISPLSTLLITPFLCFWSLPIGLVSCFILPLSPWLATKLLTMSAWGLKISTLIAAWCAAIPGSSIFLPCPSIPSIISWYVFWLALLYLPDPRARRSAYAAAALLVMLPILSHFTRIFANTTVITALNVGAGNATVFELPGGRTLLLDGGGRQTPDFEVGSRIIAPFLWQRGIRKIDGVIISHSHTDHWNGLPFILHHFRPEKLWLNSRDSDDPFFDKFLTEAEAAGTKIVVPKDEEILFHADTTTLKVMKNFALDSTHPGPSMVSPNRQSLVLRFDTTGFSALFPADIGIEEEALLAGNAAEVKIDLLLAPHHGSLSTSNSAAFYQATAPSLVVLSAASTGPDRVFALQQRLATAGLPGLPVLATGKSGAISISPAKNTLITLLGKDRVPWTMPNTDNSPQLP